MEKDMKSVTDYAAKEQRKWLRGMCFNNASVLLAPRFDKLITAKDIFNYAKSLFDEGIACDWMNYGEPKDNREINKSTGKVEVTLTEKGGREMDASTKKEKEL